MSEQKQQNQIGQYNKTSGFITVCMDELKRQMNNLSRRIIRLGIKTTNCTLITSEIPHFGF